MRCAVVLFVALSASVGAAEKGLFDPANWKGCTLDGQVRKIWPKSVCWRHAESQGISLKFPAPQDWSKFDAIAFWVHSEKATGSHFMVLFHSENRETEGPDYYSAKITIDWTGWKRFVLPFNELGAARQPLGWNHITGISLPAAGYGNTPDPAAVVRIDGVELLAQGAERKMSDAQLFENLDLNLPELAAVKKAVAAGDLKSAKAALAAHLQDRTSPRWTVDWRQPEFRTGKAKLSARTRAAAEKIIRHQFDYGTGPNQRDTLDFGPKIDWAANPTSGEARTHLWNESLNRHFHFRTLSEAYWLTGEDRYAKEVADQIVDWTASNPPVVLSSGNHMPNGSEAWQTLTTGIRLADTWPLAFYRCLGSPAFTDDVLAEMLKSVCQQSRHLVRWRSHGNWLTAESNGLFTAGVLFPEFREAAAWRRMALERLYEQLDIEVYPDGMQFELAAGYNNWVVSEFAGILELADLNGRRGEVPGDFQAKMEKMFNYLLFASMPNGDIPGLNDANNTSVRKLLDTGHKLFPKRDDFLFVASGGKQGRPPSATSHAFPYTGHYVMRSGWDADATYLLADCGPYGKGHQHEDKLHFVLWSHGRQLVLDPGNFSYDRSRWRRYVLSTPGHNTILVDGQGQHRSAKKETYVWPLPWTAPAPKENDTQWISTTDYDLVVGRYDDGYGPKNEISVRHERRIVFLKPERIFLVTDSLVPGDEKPHDYDALFHLDSPKAELDEKSLVVRTCNAGAANLAIVPENAGKLSASIVQGKEDEPVQGWASSPWRSVPTAVYRKSATGPAQFQFVLAPTGKGAEPAVRSVETAGDAVKIRLVGQRTITVKTAGQGVTVER